MKKSDKRYGIGVILLMFGGAGISEYITNTRGVFMVGVVVFSVGLALIIGSYDWKK